MIEADLRARALEFAIGAHGDQRRKYTNDLYVVHLVNVGQQLAALDFRNAVVAAAYLHDVLEDTSVTFTNLQLAFGVEVADLVMEVTDKSKPSDGNRARRKQIDLEYLARRSGDAQSIKLADLIDNTGTIVKYDPDFARVYLREKEALLQVLTWGHPYLYAQAQDVLRNAQRTLARKETVA